MKFLSFPTVCRKMPIKNFNSRIQFVLSKLDKKWCSDNPEDDTIRTLKTHVANNLCKSMGLPYKGYVNDLSLDSYDRIGFCVSRIDDIDIKIKTFIELYNKWKVPIELYGFIQHVVPKNLAKQRQDMLDTWNKSIKWMNGHFDDKYKDVVKFKGIHAQLRSKNSAEGGRPTERGIVDVNGNIIIDTPLGI